jgi:diguanylate cyclase (GGDEF)-like protein/PAS domain S-box-containing protein
MLARTLITFRWLVGPAGLPALIAGLAVLLDGIWLLGGWGGADLIVASNDRLSTILNVVAAWACWGAARASSTPQRLRQVWILFGASQLLIGSGSLFWIVSQQTYSAQSEPSVVDLIYLIGYLINVIGLIQLASSHKLVRSRAFWTDILTIVIGGSVVIWYLVLAPISQSQPADALVVITALSYPIMDMLVITLLLSLWRLESDIDPRVYLLLTVAILSSACGNIFYSISNTNASYNATALFNILWPVSFVFLIAAARLQHSPCQAAPSPALLAFVARSAALAPWGLIALAFGVLLAVSISAWGNPLSEALMIGIMLCLVAVFRQLLALREQGRELAQARREADARYQALVARLPAIIYEQDAHPPYAITFVSPLAEVLFGRPASQLLGPTREIWCTFIHPDDRMSIDSIDAETNETGAPFSAEYRICRPDGSTIWVREDAQLVSHENGSYRSWQGIVVDISDHRSLHDQLIYRVNHDPLTNIYNREYFYQQLQHASGAAQPLALCFIDLDQFKQVNDTYGHAVGDQLLIALAQRLRGSMRPSDIVARLAGDEFVALVVGEFALDAAQIAERMILTIAEPYAIDGLAIHVTPSIGVVVSAPPHQDAALLLDRADQAMYSAKSRGPGQYEVTSTAELTVVDQH